MCASAWLTPDVFPERARKTAERALCKCDDESGCGENCINRIMSYLCGKDCPCGESCTNRSLAKRPMAEVKVKYVSYPLAQLAAYFRPTDFSPRPPH